MDRNELLASLQAGRSDLDGIAFDDHRVIDWSTRIDPAGRVLDISAPSGDVQMDLTWEEIERLQRALTLLLLERVTG